MGNLWRAGLLAGCCALSSNGLAADWSSNEVVFVHGKVLDPFLGKDISKTIVTFQHASSWKYGSNFYFIDHVTTDDRQDFYGEWYPFFSSNKIFGIEYSGLIRDTGLVLGFNAGPEGDEDVLKYLPGLQIDFNIDGFNFVGLALTAYIDKTSNPANEEDDSYMIDLFWQRPFTIGNQLFSFEGHGEYIGERDHANGNELKAHALIQPQIRWDAGKTLFGEENLVQLGIEWQHWTNKYGTDEDENSLKFLFVWKL